MSQLQCFENSMFGRIRVIERDGEPWFVAKDVCECLDLDTSTLRRLDDDERETLNKSDFALNAESGNGLFAVVSEPGLYSLILGSRKPEAREFKRWITHEVIPSIRKTGGYAPDNFIERTLNDPDWAISVLKAVKHEREQRELAEAQCKLAEAQRDEAIRTKTNFVEGRDAEMCGRVGGLTRENNVLKDAVGRGRNWQTVSMMSSEWVRRFGHKPDWRKLKEFSAEVAIAPIRDVEEKIVHANGVEKVVKSYRYHKDAWERYERYEKMLGVYG